MTVEVYLGRKFDFEHERRAFGHFLQEMLDRYDEDEDLYAIIVEVEVNMAAIDLLIFTPRALVVVDLKEFIYAEGVESSEIRLIGTENGAWEYVLPDGSHYTMGGGRKNPYQQLKQMNYKLRDWLVDHPQNLPGGPWSRSEALARILSWVAISPGFDGDTSGIDMPWDRVDKWFRVVPVQELAYELGVTVQDELRFTPDQVEGIARQLGVEKCENLQQFIPRYVPPPPQITFFSRPRLPKGIVGREDERLHLLDFLDQSVETLVSIGGPGGIGKTELAAWLSGEAEQQGFRVWWVDCAEREVTAEALLAALAGEVQDEQQAAMMSNTDARLSDRLDPALGFLDRQRSLIVFNDYHEVAQTEGLEALFRRVIHRARDVKIVLTTRRRPSFLDDPECSPGTMREMTLKGLSIDAARTFIRAYEPRLVLDTAKLRTIWERTSGNPYVIVLFLTIMRNTGWDRSLEDLPFYDDQQTDRWAYSVLDTLSEDARELAYRLSPVRTGLNHSLIARVAYAPESEARASTRELADKYVLRELAFGEFLMYEFIREFLYAKAPDKIRNQAHSAAGSYFQQLARETNDRETQVESLLQAINHFQSCGRWDVLLESADTVYPLLLASGDQDRSYTVASRALTGAREEQDQGQAVDWLLRVVKQELGSGKLKEAAAHLEEALDDISRIGRKGSAEERARLPVMEARAYILKANLAYRQRDSEFTEQHLQHGIELAEQSGDRLTLARCLKTAAQIERRRGKYDQARAHLSRAGNIAHEAGDDRLSRICTSQLGLVARSQGNLAEAERLFGIAYEGARRADDYHGLSINRGLLGDAAMRRGDFEKAEPIFREVLQDSKKLGNSLGVRIAQGWLAEALIGLGRCEEAEALLDEVEERSHRANDGIGIAWTLKRRGQIEHARGNVESGDQLIREGIEKLKEIDNLDYIPDFEQALQTDE